MQKDSNEEKVEIVQQPPAHQNYEEILKTEIERRDIKNNLGEKVKTYADTGFLF